MEGWTGKSVNRKSEFRSNSTRYLYKVDAPDGKTIALVGPRGATQNEVLQNAKALYTPEKGPWLDYRKTPDDWFQKECFSFLTVQTGSFHRCHTLAIYGQKKNQQIKTDWPS